MSDTTPSTLPPLPPELEERDRYLIYKGAMPFEDLPIPEGPGDAADYQWAYHNRELHEQYQGLVVAIRHHQVWGAGTTIETAWADARTKPNCPGRDELAYYPVYGYPDLAKPSGGQEQP